MPEFTLDGTSHEYAHGDPGRPEETHAWDYGQYPKIIATLRLADGDVEVHARAQRWNPTHVLASWEDDDRRAHWAWVPAGDVRRVADSEWDIWEYHRCPANLRSVRWGDRLPGFLPT